MAKLPKGQQGRGLPSTSQANPKDGKALNSISGPAVDQGAKGNRLHTSQGGTKAPGKTSRGSASGIPATDAINTVVAPAKGTSRSTRNTGANRQRFGLPTPDGPLTKGRGTQDSDSSKQPRGGGD